MLTIEWVVGHGMCQREQTILWKMNEWRSNVRVNGREQHTYGWYGGRKRESIKGYTRTKIYEKNIPEWLCVWERERKRDRDTCFGPSDGNTGE